MERVGAGFDADVDNCTGLPTVISFRAGLNVEFLDGVDGQNRGRRSLDAFRINYRGAVVGVVIVDSVDDEVVSLRTVSIGGDGEEATARFALNAGLKHGKVLKIASLQGKLIDRLIRECLAQNIRSGLNHGSFAADIHGHAGCPRFELDVDARILGDLQLNSRVQDSLETRGLDRN